MSANSSPRSSFEDYLRQQMGDKLYYLRDVYTPSDFDDLVEAELERHISNSSKDKNRPKFRDVLKKIASRLSCK